jgi:hypothetical protein
MDVNLMSPGHGYNQIRYYNGSISLTQVSASCGVGWKVSFVGLQNRIIPLSVVDFVNQRPALDCELNPTTHQSHNKILTSPLRRT